LKRTTQSFIKRDHSIKYPTHDILVEEAPFAHEQQPQQAVQQEVHEVSHPYQHHHHQGEEADQVPHASPEEEQGVLSTHPEAAHNQHFVHPATVHDYTSQAAPKVTPNENTAQHFHQHPAE